MENPLIKGGENPPPSTSDNLALKALQIWVTRYERRAWVPDDLPWPENGGFEYLAPLAANPDGETPQRLSMIVPVMPLELMTADSDADSFNLQRAIKRRQMLIKIWLSILGQQLQADRGAIHMASAIRREVPQKDEIAQDYYDTLVRDEVVHTEVWERMAEGLLNEYFRLQGEEFDGNIDGFLETDPHLAKLIDIVMEADTIQEKIFLMQCFFEAAIIPKFKQIKSMAQDTNGRILEKMPEGSEIITTIESFCNKLMADDEIHHRSGMRYMEYILPGTSLSVRSQVFRTAQQAVQPYWQHAQWRPEVRRRIRVFGDSDVEMALQELERGKARAIQELGLTEFKDIVLPK